MALGWCMSCERLKPIKPIGLKLGSRECEWAPVEHSAPLVHEGCGGNTIAVENTDDQFKCEKCSHVVTLDRLLPGGPCGGAGRAIR